MNCVPARLVQELGVQLPDDYRGFLGLSDGDNGDVGAQGQPSRQLTFSSARHSRLSS